MPAARPPNSMHWSSISTPDPFSWNDSLRGDYLWSNVNFGEAITHVMTPLTWSVLQFTLKDWVYIPGVPTIGNIGGYPYLNISVFISLFRALGRSRADLMAALEATMFLDLPADLGPHAFPLPAPRLLHSLWNTARIQTRQALGVRKIPAYLASNQGWFRKIVAQIEAASNGPALQKLFWAELAPNILPGVWCVLGGATHSANYTIALRRELEKLVGPEDANLLIANVGLADESLASLDPILNLSRVAAGVMPKADYLVRFGHRGPDEFELSIPRPAEDTHWLDEQIELLRRSPVDAAGRLERQRQAFDCAWERLQAAHPQKARLLGRRMADSARRARLREAARSAYVRDRWSLRLFALRAGALSGIGEEIFFLTLDEVLRVLAGDRSAPGWIPARIETYRSYQARPPYPSLIAGHFDPLKEAAPTSYAGMESSRSGFSRLITGSPGSAGQVEGIVRRAASLEEGRALQPGEILVVYQTDISWTLLFPRAGAVVTDVGAPLSHTAIVARELGIPSVVGCGNAMQSLKTGDRVRVDGGRGIVEILSG